MVIISKFMYWGDKGGDIGKFFEFGIYLSVLYVYCVF